MDEMSYGNPSPTDACVEEVKKHEAHSEERAERIINEIEGDYMSHNYFKEEGDGMGGLGTAAVISAMGNRNEAGGLAALAPAIMGNRDSGFGGIGAGILGGVLGGALIGRGGLLGGDSDSGGETRLADNAANLAILAKLGNIEAAVPLAEAQVQLALAGVQNAIQGQATINATASALAVVNVKDAIQNTGVALLQATTSQGEQTRALITALNTDNLNRMLTVADLDRRDERSFARSREVEVNVSQTVNQAQAQAQAQLQVQTQNTLLAQIAHGFNGFANQLNNVHQGIVQIGAGNAAIPTTTNTNVR